MRDPAFRKIVQLKSYRCEVEVRCWPRAPPPTHSPIDPTAHALQNHVTGETRTQVWTNTNRLLATRGRGFRVDGIKTGITPTAKGCLVTSSISPAGDQRVITVTLGSPNKQMRFIDNQRVAGVAWSRIDGE